MRQQENTALMLNALREGDKVIRSPISMSYVEVPVKAAAALMWASNTRIPRIYLSLSPLPPTPRLRGDTLSKLKAICGPLNAAYYVVSEKRSRLLICVLFCKPTISAEKEPLAIGFQNSSSVDGLYSQKTAVIPFPGIDAPTTWIVDPRSK